MAELGEGIDVTLFQPTFGDERRGELRDEQLPLCNPSLGIGEHRHGPGVNADLDQAGRGECPRQSPAELRVVAARLHEPAARVRHPAQQ